MPEKNTRYFLKDKETKALLDRAFNDVANASSSVSA